MAPRWQWMAPQRFSALAAVVTLTRRTLSFAAKAS
jgi:hypothetical protein